jgi:tetratricopeptide (TPR) repeat protein
MAHEPEKALADFEATLRLHPTDRFALTGKAHLLCERLGRPAEGLAALDSAVKHHPDLAEARVGRAVVHARAGRRAEALADAQATLAKDRSPQTLFQVACVYALLPGQEPGDRDEALRLLASALRQNFGHDILETDPDLAALRDSPEFRALAAGVRALRGPRPPRSPLTDRHRIARRGRRAPPLAGRAPM